MSKSRNLIFIILVLTWSRFSFAIPNLKCITGGFPTTSFLLKENPDNVEVRLVNHNGVQFAPIYSGLATLHDIDYIKRSGDFFSKLGDDITVKFKKEKCKFEENKFYTCSLNTETDMAGMKIDSVYFSTTESVDRIPGFEFTKTTAKISFRQGQEEYYTEMDYYDDSCKIN